MASEALDNLANRGLVSFLLVSAFVILHILVLRILRFFKKDIPKLLVFPRLDAQLIMAVIPPIAFAAGNLLSFPGSTALFAGFTATILASLPCLWFAGKLTWHDLLFKPQFYYARFIRGSSVDPDVTFNHANLVKPSKSEEMERSGLDEKTGIYLELKASTQLEDSICLHKVEKEKEKEPLKEGDGGSTGRLGQTPRVDNETGELTKSCPSTVSALPTKANAWLNPRRDGQEVVVGRALLTPPHRQRWMESEEEGCMLPGSVDCEVHTGYHWRSEEDVGWDEDLTSMDSNVLPPLSLPPLPPSDPLRFPGYAMTDTGNKLAGLRPVGEGARDSSCDGGRMLGLRHGDDRLATDGGRSTASLSALDFREHLSSWDEGRPFSVPVFNSLQPNSCAPVYEWSSEAAEYTPWQLLDRTPMFIARYGFAFEDVLGSNHELGQRRCRGAILWTHAIFFLGRVVCAFVLGHWSRQHKSWTQVLVVWVIQFLTILHLIVYRPYASKVLQFVETFANVAELLIITGAVTLMLDVHIELANTVMIILFYCVSASLFLYEFRRVKPLFSAISAKFRKPK